jgi:hypothetical protein
MLQDLKIFTVCKFHVVFGLDHSVPVLLFSIEIHRRKADKRWFVEVERLLVWFPNSSKGEDANLNLKD